MNMSNNNNNQVVEPKKRIHQESNITLLPKEVTMLGVLPTTENPNFVSAKGIGPHAKRWKPNEELEKSRNMVGRPISGVVDGVFDAGYLMSVRVAGSDAIYRGVVFRPGMVVPPSVPGFFRPGGGNVGVESMGADGMDGPDGLAQVTNVM